MKNTKKPLDIKNKKNSILKPVLPRKDKNKNVITENKLEEVDKQVSNFGKNVSEKHLIDKNFDDKLSEQNKEKDNCGLVKIVDQIDKTIGEDLDLEPGSKGQGKS